MEKCSKIYMLEKMFWIGKIMKKLVSEKNMMLEKWHKNGMSEKIFEVGKMMLKNWCVR